MDSFQKEKKKMKEKPRWSKPKLIILFRGKPEENVLHACKGAGWDGPGGRFGCFDWREARWCSSLVGS